MNGIRKFRTRIFTIVMLIVCSIGVVGVGIASAQFVDIPDPNLRTVVEEALGKAAGATITMPEMENLTHIFASRSEIGDLTGLETATNLETLFLSDNIISDISPLAGLTNLKDLWLGDNSIVDISPLAGLTNLEDLWLASNPITDISVLMNLTNLTDLYLTGNSVTDISALAGLTNLKDLALGFNAITDISPLAGLTNLEDLYLGWNAISDISALAALTNLTDLNLSNNALTDISSLVSLANLRELWLESNAISDLSPLVANMGLGRGDKLVVADNPLSEKSINTHIPALENRGLRVGSTHLFFPYIDGVRAGEIFKLDLHLDGLVLFDGWGLDIAFTSGVLRALQVDASTDFFPEDTCGASVFQPGTIDNTAGTITGIDLELAADCFQFGDVLLSVTFQAKAAGTADLSLHNVAIRTLFGLDADIGVHALEIVVESDYDLNGDGLVNIFDLVLVGQNFGQVHPQADVNDDGVVNIFDLIIVAQQLGGAPAPLAPSGFALKTSGVDSATIQQWINMAHAADDGSLVFRQGLANLNELHAALQRISASNTPHRTALLVNYPNPFNPETWIPYHLARAADVQLTIYDSQGLTVRQFNLGYQLAGYYTDRTSAAYWDGRNESGESVASGIYFYQLQADDFYAMRKMVILK